ncbi:MULTISPECIES: nucleotidyltransferase domain-containing protein [Chlorobium]|uniref:DNA polymerase, beta-like region n=1 Tax=Chlorobium ferrooxidans DSM 13031 TaxID=377431 RepID=Q0YP90_9CHLB|nr:MULTISPECIES: nucleotidyltransferase domain-containing protein [Chlorobium]EAT58100.1 DNA polymerase, beta-like region [Chlorobium ferrooxidans DSM 13031]
MMRESIDTQIKHVLERHNAISVALLFGSLAKGTAHHDSDLDLAVGADHTLSVDETMALIADLATVVGRPVDLIDLATAGEPLLGQIISGGRRIVGSDTRYAELLLKHLYNEADFVPYQRRILKERREAWIGR